MVWLFGALTVILAIAVIIQAIKIYSLRQSAREIAGAFAEHLAADTNTLIDISSRDKYMRKLIVSINDQLRLLRRQRQQYLNGDRELKEAVTNISHDLRTPLTAIWGYLDLLEKKDLPADAKRYIEQIRNRSEALKQLTEELFRYSVISSTPEMSYEKINVCRVLEETLLSFEGALAEAQIVPNIQLPSSPVWRRLDATALTRIFSNIINNAVKYSNGDFTVILDGGGRIVFSNTAKELNTVEVGKLFDRFYTVDSARKSTGLGLSIAKLLTERMNGKIAANYDNDKLTITIEF